MSRSLIADGSTVLLDTVILIYFLEKHPRFGNLANSCLNRIERGEILGVISTLLFTELLVRPYKTGNQNMVSGLISRLSNFRNLSVHPVDQQTSILAARLRAEYGLRTPDAIHAATALTAGADGIVTNDNHMKRIQKEKLEIWLIEEIS